jgi:hypothetical protein
MALFFLLRNACVTLPSRILLNTRFCDSGDTDLGGLERERENACVTNIRIRVSNGYACVANIRIRVSNGFLL